MQLMWIECAFDVPSMPSADRLIYRVILHVKCAHAVQNSAHLFHYNLTLHAHSKTRHTCQDIHIPVMTYHCLDSILCKSYTNTATHCRSPSLQELPYSGKFLNGENFRIFRTWAKCTKNRTYKNFLRQHMYTQSAMAFYQYLKPLQCSRRPCKCESHISSPWWWNKHVPWIERFKLAQRVSQGVWVERPGKSKLELRNFILTLTFSCFFIIAYFSCSIFLNNTHCFALPYFFYFLCL